MLYMIAPTLLNMPTFRESLEEKAKDLVSVPAREQWDKSVSAIIRREIALTADQIDRQRESHRTQLRQLLRMECAVRTDLIQLEQRQPRYAPYHFPEKERMKQRLSEIEKERRTLSLRLEEKTQALEDRLLNLVNKHEQLDL